MSQMSQDKDINFDKKTNKITVVKRITEVFDKKEIYNIYHNLKQQLQQFENQIVQLQKTIERIKEDLRELGPIYDKIKDEVEKEFKKGGK